MHPTLIVAHPGTAHFDDVTAVSLILASHPGTEFRVERRQPTPADMDNPDVWVLDIGGRHEPDKHKFDHHQSLDCPATFVLVADYLKLTDILSVQPWWHFKDEVDRFGPVKTAQKYGAGDDLVNRSPVETWLVDTFAATTKPSAELLSIMKGYGMNLIQESRLLKSQIDFWKTSKRLVIAGRPAIIAESTETAGIDEYHRIADVPPEIVITLDKRGAGWRLFRFDGAPVDFTRISDWPEIAFSHKSGFVATTKERISQDRLIELVSKAIITDERK